MGRAVPGGIDPTDSGVIAIKGFLSRAKLTSIWLIRCPGALGMLPIYTAGGDTMIRERGVLSLSALAGASTARVLNLHHIGSENAHNPQHWEKPLFVCPAINNAFLFKHGLKADEKYLFISSRAVVTKLVIPFDRNDLLVGGQAIFVDQRGYDKTLRAAGNYSSEILERDSYILRLLNAIPSFDPFLLRDRLLNDKIAVSQSYFAISQGDQDRMHSFVSAELARLVSHTSGNDVGSPHHRLVSAMLASEVGDTLEPLRAILGLAGNDFRDGIFGWRGFLYYKWSMDNFWPDVMPVLREIHEIQPQESQTPDQQFFLTRVRKTIIASVRDAGNEVNKALLLYNDVFGELVNNQSAKHFRDFLLSTPLMFLELGEQLGAISHIVSFWRHRFPKDSKCVVDAAELVAILQDFTTGFSEKMQPRSEVIKRPIVIDGIRA
jgi:hypothetical protein